MKRNMRLFASVFAAALLATAATAASFTKTATYANDFTDVPASEWYAPEVANTFELGLMNGIGGGLFSPDGSVTVAEAVTMASRASAIYADKTIAAADGEWYAQYVGYALANGIIAAGDFDEYDRPATRAEVAVIFKNALPADWFAAKNDVAGIPDVSAKQPYHDAILALYKAGVVMGSDAYGNFRPEDNITRAEAAAIINRVALPENRLARKLDVITDDDAYKMVEMNGFNAGHEGINSGWVLDNRGGVPRNDLFSNYGALVDIRDDASAAYVRYLNKTSTGVLTLDTTMATASASGIYAEFRNEAGKSVYRIELIDGKLNVLGADGSYTPVYTKAEGDALYRLHVELDLDNSRALTYVNFVNCGTLPLAVSGDDVNVTAFVFGTTDKDIVALSPGNVTINANFAVFEPFSVLKDGLPLNWLASDATVKSGTMAVAQNGSAAYAFKTTSGEVIGEFMAILDKSQNTEFVLRSGEKVIARFASDNKNFYVNGQTVYENYFANLWYRFRFELDTDAMTLAFKVNGRYVAKDIPFAEKSTSVDNLYFSNYSADEARFDDVKVFRRVEHDDYVPVPVPPKGGDDYTIGMNVCSLWSNGVSHGWSCISAYPDPVPVLGFYDEGNPETADWEIKYLVEHGVDFQAFCVYFGSGSGPQRLGADHLFNGFQNAKYSDMSKYCIIWEASNAGSPSNMDGVKNDYFPYMLENFFKDPRYMVIDNKPVVVVFGAGNLGTRLGGEANGKEAFDWMREEIKKYGFDGIIFLANGSSSASLARLGYDGAYAYNWGNSGYSPAVNRNQIMSSHNEGSVYTVPCVSVGFNSIPWHGIRYPMMTMDDYRSVHEWVRDTYLKAYPKETWQKNFVMLSTWNEYGEGTYIMPARDEKGFGYLDTIRSVYTKETENASVDAVPTEAQAYRINHRYPQYLRLLRKQGYERPDNSVDTSKMKVLKAIDYSTFKGVAGWSMTTPVQDENGFTATSTGTDPIIIISKYPEDLNTADVDAIRITLKTVKDQRVEFFFTTSVSTGWSQDKSANFIAASDDFETYTVNTASLKNWEGKLTGVRIDPAADKDLTYTLKSVEFLGAEQAANTKVITVNGVEREMFFPPEKADDGDMLLAFDPAVGLDYQLAFFHFWDMDKKELTLYNKDHTLVYTVGKAEYLLDGAKKTLPYPIRDKDGLPMLPVKKLCADVGYVCSINENGVISIDTYEKDYYTKAAEDRVPYQWEFNTMGDTEGWSSTFFTLLTSEGYMNATTASESRDPTMMSPTGLKLIAKKYKTLEIRVRYKHDSEKQDKLTMYFITNLDSKWAEAKTLYMPLKSNDSNGEWETYTYNLADQKLWQDTITRLRFDPFNAHGFVDIDYIRFIPDPDYEEEAEELETSGFRILNGDASREGGWSSGHELSIVPDPDNKDNKVFLNVPKNNDQVWLYVRQNVDYTPGATYKVSVDVRLASHGTDKDIDDDFEATILSNAVYYDGEKNDHVVARKKLKAGDGWVHWDYEFTVSDGAYTSQQMQFTFYSDPIDGKGVGYYFDNVKVEEVKPE